ncbi:branched-chain amino acid ABC transporter substrate-binding protein, partial [Sodalis-like symbiont of Bactericera trigonica]
AMVFGIVIVNAARSRGVASAQLLTRYTIFAGLIAGIGLAAVYLTLFKLGSGSGVLVPDAQNGAEILHAYVQYTFGAAGSGFLMVLITVACLVTAVGLTCACAEFFSAHTGIGYGKLVFLLGLFSMVVSNLGLSHLITISVPVLTAIYPPCIVLILLSFTLRWWHSSSRLVAPGMLISLLFGCFDGIKVSAYQTLLPAWVERLPLSAQGLAWLPPTLVMLIVTAVYDQYRGRQQISVL